MYLTFFKSNKQTEYDINYILENLFSTNLKTQPKNKKITVEIDEEYGKRLYDKKTTLPLNENPFSFNDTIPFDEIESHYRHARIPKKSNPNKFRDLNIPDYSLKSIQSTIKEYIEQVLLVQAHDAAYAYVKQRSILNANEKHQANESKWFLQIDLKDFFPSINEDFLRRMLLQVYPFKYIPEDAFDALIYYSLYKNTLPQGSPLSPTLTNILMVPIDHKIKETLHNYNKKHYVYTRYADDIKISCKYKFNPNEIINILLDIFKEFDAPLKINLEKTKYGNIAGRNYYLGVILNKDNKISPGWRKNKQFRAMLNNFALGKITEPKDVHKMLGLISYYKHIEPNFIKATIEKYNAKHSIDIEAKAKEMIK